MSLASKASCPTVNGATATTGRNSSTLGAAVSFAARSVDWNEIAKTRTETAAMAESAYDRMRRERCKWCCEGTNYWRELHAHRVRQMSGFDDGLEDCTASSLEAWAEELAGKLETERANHRDVVKAAQSACRHAQEAANQRLEQTREALCDLLGAAANAEGIGTDEALDAAIIKARNALRALSACDQKP